MNKTFQFHKVQLKVSEDKLKKAIKQFQFHKVQLKVWNGNNLLAGAIKFQFHKVQLKA